MAHVATGSAEAPTIDPALIDRLTRRVVGSHTGRTVTTTAPFTGGPLVEFPVSSPADVEAAFTRARHAQREWAARSARERAGLFLRFHDLIFDRQSEILDIIQWETGKARRHAFEEVYDAAAGTLYYARGGPRLLRRTPTRGAMPMATRAYVRRRPMGAVSVITPWNYPLTLPVSDAIPALVAGNAVVAKPDTQTALTALWAIDLAVEAGLPEDLWMPVLGEPSEVGAPLVDLTDYVAFTGSSAAGATVARRASERLVGCSVELGGKNPMVVCADAAVDWTVRGALRACFSNAGQLCISMERLYVNDRIHDHFVSKLVDAVRGMALNTRFDFSADMGSLTYQRQLDRVSAHVEDAKEKGATILTGGRPRPDLGPLFYEPTLLTGVTPGMSVCSDETFGPVVSVYRYSDEDEVVERCNDTDYGLNASVWTRDLARGRRIAERIDAGTVNINEGYGSAWASYGAPMGGTKRSGLGRRHGHEGLLRYTEPQTIASQHYVSLGGTPGMSGEALARTLTLGGRLMKRFRIR